MAFRQITTEQYEAAIAAAEAQGSRGVQVEAVNYDSDRDAITIQLSNVVSIEIMRSAVTEWADLPATDMQAIRLSAARDALAAGSSDVHVDIAGLLIDVIPDQLFRKAFARRGGQTTSDAKATAARANGARGGRPRKPVPASA